MKHARLAGRNFDGFNLVNDGFDLNPIGTNILDCRSTYLTRNVREVLGAIISVASHGSTKVIPGYSGSNADHYFVLITGENVNKFDVGMQDCALEILCKQQVASMTDVQNALFVIADVGKN